MKLVHGEGWLLYYPEEYWNILRDYGEDDRGDPVLIASNLEIMLLADLCRGQSRAEWKFCVEGLLINWSRRLRGYIPTCGGPEAEWPDRLANRKLDIFVDDDDEPVPTFDEDGDDDALVPLDAQDEVDGSSDLLDEEEYDALDTSTRS